MALLNLHHYTDVILNYFGLLKKSICKKFGIQLEGADYNLFSVTDSDRYESIKHDIVNDEKFSQYNKEMSNGAPNAALEAYMTFLKEFPNRIEPNNLTKEKKMMNTNVKENNMMDKNVILYGPPGTGKTYNTIKKALEILDGKIISDDDFSDKSKHDEYKQRFDDYVKNKQIAFVTFHQSYSYEDFVEGLRPVIDDEGEDSSVRYEIRSGVIREICERAKAKSNFDESYDKFIENLKILGNDGKMEFKTSTGRSFRVSLNGRDNLTLYTGESDDRQGVLTREKLKESAMGKRIGYWDHYYFSVADKIKSEYMRKRKYVLIVDEINRGNISKIFGELITLIEDDKRDNLRVALPYSHEEFTVPENLYIIGTMNTADRSIAALDIALRRRFTFEEMMPDANLVSKEVPGIDLQSKFIALNKRISILLDRDHRIGHSYFMGVKSVKELKAVWFKKVIPLINEYFYGDWEKIELVIPGFVNDRYDKDDSVKVPDKLKDYCDGDKVYSFKTMSEMNDEDFVTVFNNMYSDGK